MASIGVIGAGTWGTALAVLLHNNGHETACGRRFQKKLRR